MANRTDIHDVSAAHVSREPDSYGKRRLLLGVGAGLVIALCAAWIGFSLLRPAPAPPVGETQPTTKFIESIAEAQRKHYWEFENVLIQPSPDGQKVLVSGTVKTQAHMDLLTGVLKAGQPQVPIENTVRIGR
jgi:hypothetical protein